MMTQEAILYYADHPADFVEDLLHVTPATASARVRSRHGLLFGSCQPGRFPKSLVQLRRSISFLIFCGRK